jgi:hypothetical protein
MPYQAVLYKRLSFRSYIVDGYGSLVHGLDSQYSIVHVILDCRRD